MKVGVIGCGGMGTTHYLSLKALSAQMDLEVTALADCREEFLDRAASYFPDARTYHTGRELIEQETLDIVHICLPSHLHAEHAIAAMEKGMHVFVEKPVCLTEEEGQKLLEAETRNGVKVMVGQVLRSFPEYQYLKTVYETGEFGKLKSMVMQRISGEVTWGFEHWFHDETESGSVVLDLHVHDLDFLLYMIGEPDAFDVRATAYAGGMINQIITTYEFGNVFVVTEGIWDECPGLKFNQSYRAYFEEATIWFQGTGSPTLTVYRKDGTIQYPELRREYDVQDHTAGINISDLGPYYTEIKYFAECVRDGKPVETAPLAEGIRSVKQAIREWEAAKKYVEAHR